MERFSLAEETLGYNTAKDESNSDFRLLVGGSKNVLIDFQKKVKIRSGYTRLGAENGALEGVRNGWTWKTSTGTELPMRQYDDELEVYLQTVDGTAINAWTRVEDGFSTTEIMRSTIRQGGNGGWYDATEKIDLCPMVVGDANIYTWNGAVAVVQSVPNATSVTKAGSTTFAENRFFTAANKTFVVARTGTEYTYTGGEGTDTLTGIADTAGIQAGDILLQKIVTSTNKPAASRTNHFIHNFENQIVIGSEDDSLAYGSANDDYEDFTFSSPREPGEGFLFTLDSPTRGITSLGSNLLIGAGKSVVFRAVFEQISVGATLAETANVERLNVGVNQGFLNQESIVQVGNTIFYLSNEVTLRTIEDPNNLVGINPKTLSNPIKPDFDAEDWTNACGIWYKNILFYTAPNSSRVYMLNFVQDADGKLFRFWNPPQTLPLRSLVLITVDSEERLYGHSANVPETYLLFDGGSDQQYDGMAPGDKIPIEAKAIFAYNHYGQKGNLKNFDEYYVEGEITPATTDLEMVLRYDYDGITQEITETIDGSDEDILEGSLGNNSLAQQELAVNPLGGLLNPPSTTRRFRSLFEIAREDFFELQTEFGTNDTDKYWAIITHGANAQLSRRRPVNIKI